jgi:GrpB-like predicted nucleotidyltransferase (UPF0157 family)
MLITEYQEKWAGDFSTIKEIIDSTLVGLEYSIEHIGSTAVPGLAAKPIIDIDIVFSKTAAFADLKKRLEQIGYYHHGNQGIPDREVFKRHTEARDNLVLDFIPHHLYACPDYSEELKRHILFRNYLIENKAVRMEYELLKKNIAAEVVQDRKKYAILKESKARNFIEEVIKKARMQGMPHKSNNR